MYVEAVFGETTDGRGEQWLALERGLVEAPREEGVDEPLRFSLEELDALGLKLARRYLEGRGYEVVCGFLGDGFDLLAYDGGTEVMVGVRTWVGDVDPETLVSAAAIEAAKEASLAHIARSDWDSIRYDVLGISIVSAHKATVSHFVGVCEWEC